MPNGILFNRISDSIEGTDSSVAEQLNFWCYWGFAFTNDHLDHHLRLCHIKIDSLISMVRVESAISVNSVFRLIHMRNCFIIIEINDWLS